LSPNNFKDRRKMTYRVSFDDSIRRRLAKLKDRVKPVGMGSELARVLNDLVMDLTQRPLDAGEIMYVLHHVQMPVKILAKKYLSVVFAVHESSKRVMVTKMKMLENHPFPPGFEKYLND
jgi:hypothetical protein